MDFASAIYNLLTQILYDFKQIIRSEMRLCKIHYLLVRTALAENPQDLAAQRIINSCGEFAIRKCAGSALAEPGGPGDHRRGHRLTGRGPGMMGACS